MPRGEVDDAGRQGEAVVPADCTATLLGQGYQGAVYRVDTASGPVIVKKAMGRGITRALRRAMLRREYGIYRMLAGVPGIPACHGLREGDELVLDLVPGVSLREPGQPPGDRGQFFAELLELIKAVHRAGVAHGDLKRKDNILVGPGGHPFLIDFGTAVSAPPGAGMLRRWLFRQARRTDLNAWVKLKYQRQWVEMDPADLQYHRPTLPEAVARRLRRAWRRLTLRRLRRPRAD